jgi:hypothetical protein
MYASNSQRRGRLEHYCVKHVITQMVTSYAARALAAMEAPTVDAIANSGATQIFIMEGTPVKNKRQTTCPLKVTLADW